MNLYVGNLPFDADEASLRTAFGAYGTVTSVSLITDRETGRPRGFGFVEMSDGGAEAIQQLNGSEYQGRTMTVNEAKPREGGNRVRRDGGGGRRDRY